MEKKNRKTLMLSVMVCLLPIVLGIAFYNKLPEQMPIHFTIHDVPDNYAPKKFALFAIPSIMAMVQAICMLFIIKVNKQNNNEKPRLVKIMEWFIPVITVLVYMIMIEVSLGSQVYVGKSICLILGISFMIIGNYFPKMNYEMGKTVFHPAPKSESSFRKMSKFIGYTFIGIGMMLLLLIVWV